jgi:hypothetical protein
MRLPASHDAVIIASRSACTIQRLRLLSCVYAQPTTSSPITTTAPIGSSPAPPMLSGVEVDAAWIALREHQSYLVRFWPMVPAAEVEDRAGRRRIRLVREAQSKKTLMADVEWVLPRSTRWYRAPMWCGRARHT